jgi:hypothetical protein
MKPPFPSRWALLALLLPVLAGCARVVSVPAPVVEEPRAAPAVDVGGFAPSRPELELGELLTRHPEQRRKTLRHSPLLAYVARMRALDIARRGPFSHVNRDGLGANTLVRRAGYALPPDYDHRPAGNNIESLGMGYSSARAAWGSWMRSAAHRRHLLGLHPIFVEQTEYGVGAAYGYWVVLIARPAPDLASAQPQTIEVIAGR